MPLPNRKPNRLRNYDYSQGGVYFLTLCTKNRKRLLANIEKASQYEEPVHSLTRCGEIVTETLAEIPYRYPAQESVPL